jgi:hypothetical protein
MDNVQESDFWKDQGNDYYKTGNYIDAIICYKRALETNPESHKAWYNLGMTYNRMNNKKDSRLCFEKARELSADNITIPQASQNPPSIKNPLFGGSGDNRYKKTRTDSPDDSLYGSKWRKLLYPGEWSVWFVLIGMVASLSDKPVFIFMYYVCAVAALVTMGFLLLGIVRYIIRRPSHIPTTPIKVHRWKNPNPLSTSSMNARTWAIFFLICFVALLWAVFLNNQGMMLWVGFALVMIVAGFNLVFIFRS